MNIALVSGLIILVLLIVMLIAGVPIAIALGVSSVCAILPVMNLDVAVLTGCQRIFSGISVFSLLAIPFFILAGNIMNKGGIAVRLINLAKLITGRAPGALAQTNILANMLFGSISGSGTAAASAMGSIIGPIEKDEGYDPNFSAAVNIATAPTGLLIPPSNVMITFSLVSGGTSVAALFMAGYIPGALWGLACMLVVYVIAKKKGYRAKALFTAKEAGKIVLQALPCLLLIVIVIGGIIFGVFTATEGSVVAVVSVTYCISFHYDQGDPADFKGKCRNDRNHHFPDRCIKHYVMGNGIYQYSDTCIQCTSVSQQQQNRYFTSDQCYSADRRNLYGYDTCLPDLYTDLPSGLLITWNEYDPFWYHDDL